MSLYVTHQLSDGDAEAFEKHYFGCERCWSEVQRATEIRAALAGSTPAQKPSPKPAAKVVRGPWTTWRLLAAAAAVGVISAGIYFIANRRHNEQSEASPLSVIAAAVGSHRQVEPKISGLPYRPLEPVTRGGPQRVLGSEDLQAAAAFARREVQVKPSTATHRALGIAQLMTGQADRAIATLNQAMAAAPKDTDLRNDLAAAYLVRARQRIENEEGAAADADFESALKILGAVLNTNLSSPEALFNRALLLEEKHFRDEAIGAWKAYLAVDSSSPWADEARQRLSRLMSQPTSQLWEKEKSELESTSELLEPDAHRLAVRYPQQSRLYVEDDVLPAWARAVRQGDQSSARILLQRGRAIADARAASCGDELLSDSLAAIERTSARPSTHAFDAVAHGHAAYGEARAAYRRLELDKASRLFAISRSDFAAAGSPFELQAIVGLASCLAYQSNFAGALATIARYPTLLERATARRYPASHALARWVNALALGSTDHPEEAIQSFRVALQCLDRVGEVENAAGVHDLLAQAYQDGGQDDLASIERSVAFAALSRDGGSRRFLVALTEAVNSALERREPLLALLAASAMTRQALGIGTPDSIVDAYRLLSVAQLHLGQPAESLAALEQARQWCARIDDSDVRRKMAVLVDIDEARAKSASEPEAALGLIASALEFARKHGDADFRAALYLDRGRIYAATARNDLAQAAFSAGIQEVETARTHFSASADRIAYFERSGDLFGESARLLVRAGRLALAFDIAERARARALLDLAGESRRLPGDSAGDRSRPAPLGVRTIQARLGPDVAVAEYAILSDQLLAWAVTAGALRGSQNPVSLADVESRIESFNKALQAPGSRSEADLLGAQLYDILIRPLEETLADHRLLVVVPDKCLTGVPFAALFNSRTGRYLIQDYTIATSPSASLFVQSDVDTRSGASRGLDGPLVISDPAFARDLFPSLRRLTAAQAEADAILAEFPGATVLRGDSATKARFLSLAPEYGVIHFSGHAIANGRRPMLSELLFASDPEKQDSGILYARDVAALRLRGTHLVVLAACDTGRGKVLATEGVVGLAHAFLTSGVRDVLTTQWQVDDAATSRLMKRFYEALKTTDDPAAALRGAQLGYLFSEADVSKAPFAWAALALVRG